MFKIILIRLEYLILFNCKLFVLRKLLEAIIFFLLRIIIVC